MSLELRREVPTPGYVACDPHVHTLTHSGHGDCTIEERMLTIAGEGIELPIATDHNKQIDYESIARRLQVRSHFTPVIGNEVTTAQGHFNIFPVSAEKAAPDHRLKTWPEIFAEIIRQADPPIIILNHAQDLHSGVRPFGPTLFNAAVAEHRFEWPARLNAMEVLNSGATQTDPLQLFRNWMELLNRGRSMAPIGSSDSHDVSRHFVGQGRTYLRCADQDPSQISVPDAVQALQQGRVLVSYGLLTELIVEEQYRSGDLAPARESSCRMTIRVLGPHWVQAERVLLFANGQLIREFDLSETPQKRTERGVLWSETWSLPRPQPDVHLVVVAIGPGIDKPYWRTARPYQPVTQNPATHLIGCSGAVWLDVDGDGRRTSAREYAERLVAQHRNNLTPFVTALGNYDAAVAAQAAALQHQAGMSLTDPDVQRIWQADGAATFQGFNNYVSGWRAGEIARQQSAAPQ